MELATKMKQLSDLRGKNIVVYDLEIKKSIDNIRVKWTDYDKMGISVGCLFDFETGDTKVYLDDNLTELVSRINRADLVTGYNITGFDNHLLSATTGLGVRKDNSYDMLSEVRRSTGKSMPSGCKLNDVLNATFGISKTEDGADAPLFYQRGQFGKLISYCLADVRRERMAFEYAYVNGFLKTISHGLHKMNCPIEIIKNRLSPQ